MATVPKWDDQHCDDPREHDSHRWGLGSGVGHVCDGSAVHQSTDPQTDATAVPDSDDQVCGDLAEHDPHKWRAEGDRWWHYCDGSASQRQTQQQPLTDELRQESITRLIGLADRLRGMLEAAAEPVMPPRGEHYPAHSRALTRDYHLGWAAYHAQAADDGMRLLGLIDRDTPEGAATYQDIAHDRQFAMVHQLAALNLGVDRMAVLLEHIAGMHNLSAAQGGPPATDPVPTVEHTGQEGGQS